MSKKKQVDSFLRCTMFRKARCLVFHLLVGTSSIAFGQETKWLQHRWEIDPPLGDIWEDKYIYQNILFDVEQLKSRFAEERLSIAQNLCREYSNPKLIKKERAVELLLLGIQNRDEYEQIKRAMISALLLLGDASLAEKIWSQAEADLVVRPNVERQLIRWKSPVARDVWRKRIADPHSMATDLATALEGIAAVGGIEDQPSLQAVILANDSSMANKFLAAIALGALATDGMNEFAQKILDSNLEQKYLIAAHMLKRHSGDTTAKQLQQILSQGPASAQLVAFRSLSASVPDDSKEFGMKMASHTDPGLRMMALQLLQRFSDEESLKMQGRLLGDHHPEVRKLVVKHLLEKAAQGQREWVDQCLAQHFASDEWTGLEKGIALAVGLQDRSHCKTFLRLLDHPRPEVNMMAGWALMELGDEAETLSGMLAHAEKMVEDLKTTSSTKAYSFTDQIKLSYLNEGFGKNLYQAAEPILLLHIPKGGHRFANTSRSSAIWALGKLNKGKKNPDLLTSLNGRLTDLDPIIPEDYLVRFSCNLALGEMANPESREIIEKFRENLTTPIGIAATWALSEIDKASKAKPAE
ncbi:MAG: HEAT repeat domain-containing protein [Planctomycetota bacterium]|nr:HEAT repeat domain-containing protein [Planctomycetota bacterium]